MVCVLFFYKLVICWAILCFLVENEVLARGLLVFACSSSLSKNDELTESTWPNLCRKNQHLFYVCVSALFLNTT